MSSNRFDFANLKQLIIQYRHQAILAFTALFILFISSYAQMVQGYHRYHQQDIQNRHLVSNDENVVWLPKYSESNPRYSESNHSHVRKPDSNVVAWIVSSECAKRHQVFLTACILDDKLIPYEDFWVTDDVGYALLSNLFSRLTQKNITHVLVVIFNVFLNAVSATVLLLFLFWQKRFLAAILFASLFGVMGAHMNAHTHGGFGWISISAFLPALLLVVQHFHQLSRRWFCLLATVALTALAVAALFRHSIAAYGFVLLIFTVILLAIDQYLTQRRTDLKKNFAVIILALFALYTPDAAWNLRDALYDLPEAETAKGHGFMQTVVATLGLVADNKWGFMYSIAPYTNPEAYPGAQNEMTIAKSINPDVILFSEEYFDIIASFYWQQWRQHPGEMVRIYLIKTYHMLYLNSLASVPMLVFLFPLFFSALYIIYSWVKNRREIIFQEFMVLITSGYVGLFLIQGIIGTSFPVYFLPALIYVFFSFALAMDRYFTIAVKNQT